MASWISSSMSLPQPLNSLANLAKQQRDVSARERLSAVSWFSDVFRFKASAVVRVYKAVIWVTIWASVVAVASVVYGRDWGLTNSVVPLLSVVVGLLLVFRNGTAYSRWEDGRKTFSAQSSVIRTAARYIWVNVGSAPFDADRVDSNGIKRPYQHADWTEQDKREKEAALRLLVAVIVSTKRHVRHEFGTDWEDLKGLLPDDFRNITNRADYGSFSDLPARTASPSAIKDADREARMEEDLVLIENDFTRPSVPLPLVVLHNLQMYISKMKDGVGPSGYNTLCAMLATMTDEIGTVERLNQMPIPVIYGVHLKQCVTVYLMLLPLTLVGDMSWKMILFVTCFAFVLMGIEAIATEIEMPFGYDNSDLPLDLLAAEVRNEIEHQIAHMPECPLN